MCSWRRTMSAASSSSWRRRSHRPLAPPPLRQAARPSGGRPREGGRCAVVRSREALRRARPDRSRSLPCTPQRSVARGHRRSDSVEPRFSRSRGPGRRAGETGRRTAASEGRPWAYASPPGGTRTRRRRRSRRPRRAMTKVWGAGRGFGISVAAFLRERERAVRPACARVPGLGRRDTRPPAGDRSPR